MTPKTPTTLTQWLAALDNALLRQHRDPMAFYEEIERKGVWRVIWPARLLTMLAMLIFLRNAATVSDTAWMSQLVTTTGTGLALLIWLLAVLIMVTQTWRFWLLYLFSPPLLALLLMLGLADATTVGLVLPAFIGLSFALGMLLADGFSLWVHKESRRFKDVSQRSDALATQLPALLLRHRARTFRLAVAGVLIVWAIISFLLLANNQGTLLQSIGLFFVAVGCLRVEATLLAWLCKWPTVRCDAQGKAWGVTYVGRHALIVPLKSIMETITPKSEVQKASTALLALLRDSCLAPVVRQASTKLSEPQLHTLLLRLSFHEGGGQAIRFLEPALPPHLRRIATRYAALAVEAAKPYNLQEWVSLLPFEQDQFLITPLHAVITRTLIHAREALLQNEYAPSGAVARQEVYELVQLLTAHSAAREAANSRLSWPLVLLTYLKLHRSHLLSPNQQSAQIGLFAHQVSSQAIQQLDGDWQAFEEAVAFASKVQKENIEQVTTFMSRILSHLTHSLDLPPVILQSNHTSFRLFILDSAKAFTGMWIPETLPVIFLARKIAFASELDDLRQILTSWTGRTRVALLITPSDPIALKQIQEWVDHKICKPYAVDVVVTGREQLRKIIKAEKPQGALRRLIFAKIDLKVASPFITGGYTPEQMFFGRERELREITQHVGRKNYALIGGRRIGKTSILKRLEYLDLPATFRVFFHDTSYTLTEAELIKAVLSDRKWFPQPPDTPPTSFSHILHALPNDKPVVILLDEVDKLIQPDKQSGYRLFSTWRAHANAGQCRFVFAGERTLQAELRNPDSPLYNFANQILIGRLDIHAVWELVTRPMKDLEIKLEEEADIVERIWYFTAGHPNVVQRLCHRLVLRVSQRNNLRLTLDDLDAVITDLHFLRHEFIDIYWERATALERLCSLVMSAEQVRTLTAVHEALGRHRVQATLNEVNNALERLVELRNILTRIDAKYGFAVAAFPKVLAQSNEYLLNLIALNRDTYQLYGDVVSQ